jgi:hypothetical protein
VGQFRLHAHHTSTASIEGGSCFSIHRVCPQHPRRYSLTLNRSVLLRPASTKAVACRIDCRKRSTEP